MTHVTLESPQQTELTSSQILYMMTDDYLDSLHGVIKTQETGHHTPEDLSDLRRSIAAFSILHDIELSEPAKEIGVSEKQLQEDLAKDEVLLSITNTYAEQARQAAMPTIDRAAVRQIKLPTISGRDLEAAFERLGFTRDRNNRHPVYEKIDEDGEKHSAELTNHPSKDVPIGTLRKILKDAGVTIGQLVDAL